MNSKDFDPISWKNLTSAFGVAFEIFCSVVFGEDMSSNRSQDRFVARAIDFVAPRKRKSVSGRRGSVGKSLHRGNMFQCEVVEYCHANEAFPEPRSGHRIVCDNEFLYCFGGYNPELLHRPPRPGLLSDVWQYNFSSRKWNKLDGGKDCPPEAASHSMVLYGETLLVWGGTGYPFGERCGNQLHAFHIPSRQWRRVECGGEVPSGRYGQSMTLMDGSIYVIGGTSGSTYNMSVHRLDLETLQWDAPVKAPMMADYSDENPRPRYRHEVATYQSRLYVLGGGTADQAFDFEKIPVYDTKTKKWTTLTSQKCPINNAYPAARRFHAAVQHGDSAYICGGFQGRSDGENKVFDDVWKLHIPTLQWTKLKQKMPVATYFHSASVTPDGCLYCFGGVITPKGDLRSNGVIRLWLTVPSLQEIAWNAVTSRGYQTFAKTKPEALKEEGIPLPVKFLKRLQH